MPAFVFVLCACLLVGCASSRAMKSPDYHRVPEGFTTFTPPTTGGMKWVIYVPREYDGTKSFPAIVFLNGRGECGTDGWKQVAQGLGRSVLFNRDRWPFIILFPQKPEATTLWAQHGADVMAGLAHAKQQLNIDCTRIYLTGLSQGGAGTWAIARDNPGIFAAIAPVCGFGDATSLAPALSSMPVWCFHGGADDIVSPQHSRDAVKVLRESGNLDVVYTEFAGVNHNSWDPAYNTPELPQWFLARSLAQPIQQHK